MNDQNSGPIIFKGNREDPSSCIIDMINFLENKHGKQWTRNSRAHITLYAHNSGAFDTYLILQNPLIKFKNIIKTASWILRLDVLTPSCKIHFLDTYTHLSKSLARLCKDYKLDKNDSKMGEEKGFEWNEITHESWE